MYYYVFIDPEIVPDAVAEGGPALDSLIGILRGFRRGCIMTETDSWEIGMTLGEHVKDIPDDFHNERKLLNELVIHHFLKGGGPWVVLDTDGDDRPFIEVAIERGTEADLDLLLTPVAPTPSAEDSWESCSYSNFNGTTFSASRDRTSNGYSFREGAIEHEGLFDQCFAKMLRYAEKIVITDYALGEHYNNTQPENMKRWVRSIETVLDSPGSAKVVIRTMRSAHSRSIETDVEFLKNEVDLELELEFLADKVHRRFLVADSHCLNTDRGVDICYDDGTCREFGINYDDSPA